MAPWRGNVFWTGGAQNSKIVVKIVRSTRLDNAQITQLSFAIAHLASRFNLTYDVKLLHFTPHSGKQS